jgi:hypothetical protein
VIPARIVPPLFAVAAFALCSSMDATAKPLSLRYPLPLILAGTAGLA